MMKRDMDLIRALLLNIEGDGPVDMSKWTEAQRLCHGALLVEAGLVHGEVVENQGREVAAVVTYRLTWDGCEFLDMARDPTVWDKARQALGKVGGSVALPVLTALLSQFLKDHLGIK